MAADTKIEKTVARVMMQMTNEINAKLAASIKKPADQIARVECATCHRGAAIPVTPPPPPPPAGGGAPSGSGGEVEKAEICEACLNTEARKHGDAQRIFSQKKHP